MAYRTADHTRWQQMNFVVGIEIKLSNNHNCRGIAKGHFYDICDELAGVYPKDFKFVGWHPFCRCFAVPKLADMDEFLKYQDQLVAGEDVNGYKFSDEVTQMPKQFNEWVKNNKERITSAKSLPYFLRDNYVGGDISKGLMFAQKPLSIKERAAIRHSQRTQEQIEDIKRRNSERLNAYRLIDKTANNILKVANEYAEVDVTTLKAQIAKRDMFAIKAETQKVAKQIAEEKAKQKTSMLASSSPHKAIKTIYTENEELNDTFNAINEELTTAKWFEHGALHLSPTTKSGVNGFTNMCGDISLRVERLERVKSAMGKIGQGKSTEIIFEEADAMATLWHEITHNRNKIGNIIITDTQRDIMEMMNEFVARKTLPEFYNKLGVNDIPYPEFIVNRASTGYNQRVLAYDFLIDKLGLDKVKVLESAKKNLFTLSYADQQTTAIEALLDGGLDMVKRLDGKPIEKAQLNKLIAYCRRGVSETTLENYMKNEGII